MKIVIFGILAYPKRRTPNGRLINIIEPLTAYTYLAELKFLKTFDTQGNKLTTVAFSQAVAVGVKPPVYQTDPINVSK